MEEHWTNKKNNPAMENKGSVTPFCAMLAVKSICWIVAQGLVTSRRSSVQKSPLGVVESANGTTTRTMVGHRAPT